MSCRIGGKVVTEALKIYIDAKNNRCVRHVGPQSYLDNLVQYNSELSPMNVGNPAIKYGKEFRIEQDGHYIEGSGYDESTLMTSHSFAFDPYGGSVHLTGQGDSDNSPDGDSIDDFGGPGQGMWTDTRNYDGHTTPYFYQYHDYVPYDLLNKHSSSGVEGVSPTWPTKGNVTDGSSGRGDGKRPGLGCTYQWWVQISATASDIGNTQGADRQTILRGSDTTRFVEYRNVGDQHVDFNTEMTLDNGYRMHEGSMPVEGPAGWIIKKWHQITVVFDERNFHNDETPFYSALPAHPDFDEDRHVTWYKDGKPYYSQSIDTGTEGTDEYFAFNNIGASHGTGDYRYGNSLSGSVRSMAVYGKPLDEDEIKQNYNALKGQFKDGGDHPYATHGAQLPGNRAYIRHNGRGHYSILLHASASGTTGGKLNSFRWMIQGDKDLIPFGSPDVEVTSVITAGCEADRMRGSGYDPDTDLASPLYVEIQENQSGSANLIRVYGGDNGRYPKRNGCVLLHFTATGPVSGIDLGHAYPDTYCRGVGSSVLDWPMNDYSWNNGFRGVSGSYHRWHHWNNDGTDYLQSGWKYGEHGPWEDHNDNGASLSDPYFIPIGQPGEQLNWDYPYSDNSLKFNKKLLGKSKSGLNVYEFKYKWDRHLSRKYRGVIAQELLKTNPDAVGKRLGYYTVDYSKIDVDFRIVIDNKNKL